MSQAKRPCDLSRHLRHHASHEPGRVACVRTGRRGRSGRRRTTCCQAAQARILPHSITCRGGVYANASQADRRKALEREQPVVCRDCPFCDFHPTLTSVLGAALDLSQALDMAFWLLPVEAALPQVDTRWLWGRAMCQCRATDRPTASRWGATTREKRLCAFPQNTCIPMGLPVGLPLRQRAIVRYIVLERSVAMSRNAQGHSPCLSPPAMLDYI